MKNKKIYAVLMVVIMVIVGGCGKQVETNNNTEDATVVENTNVTEESNVNVVENESSNDNEVADETKDFNPVITEKNDSELNFKDYRDYLEDKTLLTDDDAFANGEFEFADENAYFLTTEQIPMYASNGVRTGYIKEDVDFSVIAICGDWCYFYLGNNDKRYAKLSDIKSGSMNSVEIEEMQAKVEEEAKAQAEANKSETQNSTSSAQETVPDTTVEEAAEVPVTSDKYTPDEAIAVFRGIMDSGLSWDPSLKDVASWGTGFLYLDKGYPEWAGQTNLESAAMGDSVGNPWTRYYIEVTGSDDECVYYTIWEA